MYMDTMHLPKSGSFKYFVQGHCSLAHFPKYHSLHAKTVKTIRDWIFKDILCRLGTLCKIVTDNGPVFIKALTYLRSSTTSDTSEYWGTTLGPTTSLNGCILMSDKCYSRPAMETNRGGIPLSPPSWGLTKSQSTNGWAVPRTLQ